MPVILERLTQQVTAADLIDLNKVLTETGPLWRQDLSVTPTDAAALVQHIPEGFELWGARFNDHIIGLLLTKRTLIEISQSECTLANQIQIESKASLSERDDVSLLGVCVRPLTQKRSVASQMLIRVCQMADQKGWRLLLSKDKLKRVPFLEAGIQKAGFRPETNAWVRLPGLNVY